MDPIPNPIRPSSSSSSSSSSATTTTYVQADPLSFRDVVQRLTGASASAAAAAVAPRRAPFKLRDRRGGALHLRLSPSPLRPHHHLHHHRSSSSSSSSSFARAQSPTAPSPKSPLGSDPLFSPPPAASSPSPGKETPIPANRFFFLPPSPRILAAAAPPASPELLPLFPLSSPAQLRRGDGESSVGDKSM